LASQKESDEAEILKMEQNKQLKKISQTTYAARFFE